MSTAMVYLLVACGGGIGALLRFCLVQTVAFPYGTLSVNVIGSFLMGLAFAYFAGRLGEVAPLFLMAGILGGFTTFSAFSLDLQKLLDMGQFGFAFAYICGSVLGGLVAVFLGFIAMRLVSA